MKIESCNSMDPIWTSNVEMLPNEECLPLIGTCQVSSILSTLAPQDTQGLDIILQHSNYKVTTENANISTDSFVNLKDKSTETVPPPNKIKSDSQPNFDQLLYFVCNLCSYLCVDNKKIAEHLETAHINKNPRKLIQLKCPACSNVFSHKISLRSHLIHDHSVSDTDIAQIIKAVVYYSRIKPKQKKNSKQSDPAPQTKLEQKTEKDSLEKFIYTDKIFNGESNTLSNNFNNNTTAPKLISLPQNNLIPEKVDQMTNKQGTFQNSVNKAVVQKKFHACIIPNCKVKLSDSGNINYHINCHAGDFFICLECNQEFPTWKNLTGHLWRMHHIDMELFSCDQCNYKTFSLGKLNNIHKPIHSNVKSFVCTVCQKAFKNTKQLTNHRAVHKDKSEKFIHNCDSCQRKFADKRQLKMHVDIVHKKLKPFLCNFCGYKGSSKSSLKMHIRQHTGEKPFACDSCSYTTADHNSLRRHKLRHTGQKPYKCKYCSYACIQSNTYKVHLKTKHPGQEKDLMFTCHLCQFRSVNKDMFVSHMNSLHKDSPHLGL